MPRNAIEPDFFKEIPRPYYKFVTMDGYECKARFNSSWKNENGIFDDSLDFVCRKNWGVPYATVKSMWIARLGTVDEFWYILRLEKL